jgi:hypothetical protein
VQADLEVALETVSRALIDSGVPHAFLGALGRAAWGRARTTTDLDVQVHVTPTTWPGCVAALAGAGLKLEITHGPIVPEDGIPDHGVFRFPGGLRLDVLIAKTEFQAEAVARAVTVSVFGRDVRVVTVEDLVVFKLIAGRPRDVDDIDDVLDARSRAGLPVDWPHLERWAAVWGLEERVSALRARFGPRGGAPGR